MNIIAKVFSRCKFTLLLFQQWSTGKTDEHDIITHNFFHGLIEYTTLCTMTFINKDKYIAFSLETFWQFFGKCSHILFR